MKVTIDLLTTDELDEFLMSRIDEDKVSESLDEGNDYSILLEISTLCRKVLCPKSTHRDFNLTLKPSEPFFLLAGSK